MKRLYRSRKNKVFAGICGGLGEHYETDPVIIRIIAVVATLFTGIPFFIYIVAIFIIPLEPLEGAEAAAQPVEVKKTTGTAGTTTGTGKSRGTSMEEHVRILGILYIALSALGLVIALIVFVAVTGGGLISGDETAIAVTSIVAIVGTAIIVLVCAPGIIGGMGLLKRQSWARILVLVLGVIHLINIPFGTALGIYTIWTLTNKETEALFRNG